MRTLRLFFLCCLSLLSLNSMAQKKKEPVANSGKASFYHDSFQGQETSNGEFYNKNDFTAAHKTLPFNTIVNVYNKQNGKKAIVRINDRGPFVRSRIIDLSRSAAMKLGMVPYGVSPVSIQVLNLFDHLAMNDSTFIPNDVWDCFGRKTELCDETVFVWQTDYWKHAFYMASHLALDYHLPSAQILISGEIKNRTYKVLVSNRKDEIECKELIDKLQKDGFIGAKIFKVNRHQIDSSANPPHGGR
ncbi:MAG: septal ring lytic transglycosylase RlpA family protein [Bacteroidetes bacterium]|nr:septal ring lytic transglycosylase RlpA family protein [Bacteroidota bacterium]